MRSDLIYLIPLLPLLGAAFNLLFGRKLSKQVVHFVAIGSVAAAFLVSLYLVVGPLWEQYTAWKDKKTQTAALYQHVYTWIEVGGLKIDMAFVLDTLSAVMILVITFVGTLIHIYSTGYMADEKRYAAYFGYLNLFTGSMLILVLANSLPVMFIGWEGVGLCSFLLIGFWFEKEENAHAGRKAFIVNRVGDFAFLLGICLIWMSTKSVDFYHVLGDGNSWTLAHGITSDELAAWKWKEIGDSRMALIGGLLLFIGACGKSAQIPLYVWLPDAMAGPTPVSALIHAATMVTAGVYMVARMSFMYANSTGAMAVVAGVGALTALFAAIMAFAQKDLKKVLAYSTVSQLGFMFVAVGVGAYAAGIFHLVTHAFFKAGLFLAAGSVMHAMSGSGDITKMGGLRAKLPRTHISFLIYCIAIAGIFPLSGFFSKDEILAGAFGANAPDWGWGLYGEFLWVTLSLAAFGTAFYMFRLYFLVFGGDECRADAEVQSHIHESPPSMTIPLLILAGFTCVLGFVGLPHIGGLPNFIGSWLTPSVSAMGSKFAGHPSTGTLVGLMGAALFMGLAGIGLAYSFYGKGPSEKVASMTSSGFGKWFHNVVYNKFYVDELYELVILRPFRWLCRGPMMFVDKFVIDTVFVGGTALIVDVAGRLTRWFQNGQVQRYLAGIVVGGALIFLVTDRGSDDKFKYEQDMKVACGVNAVATKTNCKMTFRAAVGTGPSAHNARVVWKFHDKTQLKGFAVTKTYPKAGSYKVIMEVTGGAGNEHKKTRTYSRNVEVKATLGKTATKPNTLKTSKRTRTRRPPPRKIRPRGAPPRRAPSRRAPSKGAGHEGHNHGGSK